MRYFADIMFLEFDLVANISLTCEATILELNCRHHFTSWVTIYIFPSQSFPGLIVFVAHFENQSLPIQQRYLLGFTVSLEDNSLVSPSHSPPPIHLKNPVFFRIVEIIFMPSLFLCR